MKILWLLLCTTAGFAAGTLTPGLEHYLNHQPSRAAADEPRRDERVSLVCELGRENERQQWLITIGASPQPIRDGEASTSGIVARFQRSLFCSTGREYQFADEPFAMHVQMIGPFTDAAGRAAAGTKTVSARAVGNAVYFDEGIFPTALVYERIQTSGADLPSLAFLFRANYSAERIATDRARAEAAGMTIEDEREIARSAFALNQFGMVASRVKGFRDVLETVIELPTLLRGMFINIDWKKLQRTDAVDPQGGRETRFAAPIALQTKTRLSGTITFVQPRGPLKYCAGIVEAQFDHSEKAPGTSLKLWLLH